MKKENGKEHLHQYTPKMLKMKLLKEKKRKK
jgi:hypothetical protein